MIILTHLQIKDLQIKNYKINLDIENKEVVGIYSKDQSIIKEFLDMISGINPTNKSCLYKDKDVFNNLEYFQERIYLDFSKKYLSTLKLKYLEERLKSKYNFIFNKDKFIKICKDLDVRGETEITHVYKFSLAGNIFVNFALVSSINRANLIIQNPTKNLNMMTDIQYITEKLAKKDVFNTVILGLDNLRAFSYLLDKLVLFSSDNVHVIDPLTENLIVFKKPNPYLKNIIYNEPNIITLNSYSKEDYKNFSKDKIDFKKISVYDLESYLHGGKHEK